MNYHNKQSYHLNFHPMQLDVQIIRIWPILGFDGLIIVEFSTNYWKEMNNVIMFIMLFITTRKLQSQFLFWEIKTMTKGLIPKLEKKIIGFFQVMFTNNIIIYAYPFIHNKLVFYQYEILCTHEVYLWFKCNNLQLSMSTYI